MQIRYPFHSLICLTMVVCLPIAQTQAQDSQSTRIFRAANQQSGGDLDPSSLESEVIEGISNQFETLPIFKRASATQQSNTTIKTDGFSQSNGQIQSNKSFGQQPSRPIHLQSPIHGTHNRQEIDQKLKTSTPPTSAAEITTRDSGNKFNSVSMPTRIDGNMYETKSTPTIQTQIVAPRATIINQTARFFIQAKNVGTTNVSTVKLIATIPEDANFINSNPQPSNINGQQYEFTLKSLSANMKQVIQIDVVPTTKTPLNISTQIQIESQQQVSVAVQQPILEISVAGPDAIQTGQTLKHVVSVKNIGDGVAEAVRLNTTRPDGLRANSQPQKTLVPKLVPGQTAKFELSSFATTAGNSKFVFKVSARGAETQETQSSIHIVRPELGVQILGPGENYLGREGIYSIQLQNTSEMPITEVGVQLNVPNGLQIDTISQQAKIDKNSGTLSWNFKSIPANQQQVIQFRAKAVAVGNQVCRINVQTKETASRQMTLKTEIRGRADMSIRVTDSGEPVGIGGKSEFTIEVANHGSQNAQQVAVKVELPSALMPVNQSGYSIDPSGNVITFNNITVDAGKRKAFKFKVVAVTPGEHIVRGTVSIEGSTKTISSENSIFVFESENTKVSEALVPEIRR